MKAVLKNFLHEHVLLYCISFIISFFIVFGIKTLCFSYHLLGIQDTNAGADVLIAAISITIPFGKIFVKLVEIFKLKIIPLIIPENPKLKKILLQAEISKLENNFPQAFNLYKQAAEYGDTEATIQVGFMTLLGMGCNQDQEKGVNIVLHAIEQSKNYNLRRATYFRLYCIFSGNNFNKSELERDKNYSKAKEYLMQCSDSFDMVSCTVLASNFYAGTDGFTKDEEQAIKFHIKGRNTTSPIKYYISLMLIRLVPFLKNRELAELEMNKKLQDHSISLPYNAQIILERDLQDKEKQKILQLKHELSSLNDH